MRSTPRSATVLGPVRGTAQNLPAELSDLAALGDQDLLCLLLSRSGPVADVGRVADRLLDRLMGLGEIVADAANWPASTVWRPPPRSISGRRAN